MTVDDEVVPSRPLRLAPLRARLIAVWAAICYEGTLSVIAVLALHGSAPRHFDIAGAIVLAILWVVIAGRAAMIELVVDRDQIMIRNRYRTRVLRWGEVERVWSTSRVVAVIGRAPVIVFRTTSGHLLWAYAVPAKKLDREAAVRDIALLAPPSIAFGTT